MFTSDQVLIKPILRDKGATNIDHTCNDAPDTINQGLVLCFFFFNFFLLFLVRSCYGPKMKIIKKKRNDNIKHERHEAVPEIDSTQYEQA